MKDEGWVAETPQENDLQDLLALFRECFQEEMTPEFWRWKYALGEDASWLVRSQGQVVAYHGAVARAVRALGEEKSVLYDGDVMVKPSRRWAGGKRGMFYRITRLLFEKEILPAGKRWLAFGFPHERHARLGKKLGLYKEISRVVEFSFSPRRQGFWWRGERIASLSGEREARILLKSWEAMAKDLQGAVVMARAPEFYRRRVFGRPGNAYETWIVRGRLGGAAGVLVLARHAQGLEISDWVGPRQGVEAALAVACARAREVLAPRVMAWASYPFAPLWRPHATEEKGIEGCLVVNDYPVPFDENTLGEGWWFSPLDTDFR